MRARNFRRSLRVASPRNFARASVYFARPTIAIAKIRDYSQSSQLLVSLYILKLASVIPLRNAPNLVSLQAVSAFYSKFFWRKKTKRRSAKDHFPLRVPRSRRTRIICAYTCFVLGEKLSTRADAKAACLSKNPLEDTLKVA